jgi:phosphate transport system protein
MSLGLRAAFDKEIEAIKDDLLRMRELIDDALIDSFTSLSERDRDLAQQVIESDENINDLRFKIEEACLALIATQQPAARDLRSVIAYINVVVDMERMGDHATGIARTVLRMGDEPLLKPLIDTPKMVELARGMLRDILQALFEHDADWAREIAARDDEMDRLYMAIFDELVEIMAERPGTAPRATYLLWCAHNLERIGDRVTNIAERVIFITTGEVEELNIKDVGPDLGKGEHA